MAGMTQARQEADAAHAGNGEAAPQIVLSFDVEEHHRIEAAAGLSVESSVQEYYRARVAPATRWLLDELARHEVRATFFIVGDIARHSPELIRAIDRAGHEVASHSWDHRRVHHLTPETFRQDLQQTRDAFEQLTGKPVLGYRAPTFSIVAQTAWALDVLAELGFLYDSSIYPVRHDRYGVPHAPRAPFLARGERHSILELPPATLRFLGMNVPAGGGGYFRLFPLFVMERALRQTGRDCRPPIAMLYFHPWEFDPEQARLPLRPLSRFRTYVGIGRSRDRLAALIGRYRFTRAIDVARQLERQHAALPTFTLAESKEQG